ncbi:MAG TPA: hypothetical protein VIR54_24675 [Vicinamibacterales bacterium]|jgi:hypothetical protein
MSSPKHLVLILCMALAPTVSLQAGNRSGKKTFQDAWEGRTVVVQRMLYSVVFDERSRHLPIVKRKSRVSGLTVVTPAGMYYYQFDSRREEEDDIIDKDPEGIVTKMRNQYIRTAHLADGAVQDIEPLMLVRYAPGVSFIVKKVQIDRDRVRLFFNKAGEDDLATTLTVKFPTPLSNELTESTLIDSALGRFVARK